MGKMLIWIIVPSTITYIFWFTYKYFNRNRPQEGSKEDKDLFTDDYI